MGEDFSATIVDFDVAMRQMERGIGRDADTLATCVPAAQRRRTRAYRFFRVRPALLAFVRPRVFTPTRSGSFADPVSRFHSSKV